MPVLTYREGASPIIPQQVSVTNPQGGGLIPLITVPDGFFMRWRWLHWIMVFNTADATFRYWFVNVVTPDNQDFGQIIPGQAAVGGGSAPTTSPLHETMDATLAVFFDEVFQGAAGVQPEWDYSGFSSQWWPPGFKFVLDATKLVAGDQFQMVNGMVELIEAEPVETGGASSAVGAAALAYYLHTPGE